ncbi:MAG: CBS domain-containing protein [Bacteroidota bacterium]
MGYQKVREISGLQERREYLNHLLSDINALGVMHKKDLFEKKINRIGAEQELFIVDKNFRPSRNALKILKKIEDRRFTTEIALFNLEINIDPLILKGDCFSNLEDQLKGLIKNAQIKAKQTDNNKVLLTGILPTLKKKDLVFRNITPHARYKTLNKVLKKIRGRNFRLHLRGVDELILTHESILFEACNTSFQVHLQIDPDNIIDKYNWSQAIAGPVLAATANSPLLFGRELWSETRIALFQQSMDTRNASLHLREQKSRVSFGTDWVRNSILELYWDDIARYTPLVTTDFKENSLETLERNEIPKLRALQLLNGTLYKWNRLCYGITDGIPHLRIENRYVPSGPSVIDEVANAVFWIGLMQGLPKIYRSIQDKMAFNEARGNFINAARTGINTYFNWFGKGISARKLILNELLPIAKKGLKESDISPRDIKKYLNIIKKRVEKRKNGSVWMINSYRSLTKEMTRDVANATIVSCMYGRQQTGKPVHEWKLAKAMDCFSPNIKKNKLEKIMTTELFVVHENDLVALIDNIMKWKNIHHMPVVNNKNKLVGVVSSSDIDKIDIKEDNLLVAKDVMIEQITCVESEITIEEAKEIMIKNKIGCLPVLENGELTGIITRNDLEGIYQKKIDSEE